MVVGCLFKQNIVDELEPYISFQEMIRKKKGGGTSFKLLKATKDLAIIDL